MKRKIFFIILISIILISVSYFYKALANQTNLLAFFQTNLPRDSQGNYIASVGQTINYYWSIPGGTNITSFYTADAPDNCPGGLTTTGEIKPWEAKTASGQITAVVQQCQAGKTYTITISNNNQPVLSIKVKISPTKTISLNTQDNKNISIYQGPIYSSQLRSTLESGTDILNRQNSSQQFSNQQSIDSIFSNITSIISSLQNMQKSSSPEVLRGVINILQSIISVLQNLAKTDSSNLSLLNQTQTQTQTQNQTSNSNLNQSIISTSVSKAKIFQKLTSVPSGRYIKDEITKSGWVAIREMEIYDKNGNKIDIKDATASCDWCGYGTPPYYSGGPKAVFDGNLNMVWNAGETAPNCSWYTLHVRNDGIYGYGCMAQTVRSAWIQVDLGKVYDIGRIKIRAMGESPQRKDGQMIQGDTPRTDKIYVSADGINYQLICELKASYDNPLIDDGSAGPDSNLIECAL